MAEPAPPIVVNPSPVGEQVASGVRQLVVLLGGFVAIAGFLRQRDLAGLVGYLQSGEFVPVVGALAAAAAVTYAQLKTRWRKREAVTMADAAPDSVAIVATPDTPKP